MGDSKNTEIKFKTQPTQPRTKAGRRAILGVRYLQIRLPATQSTNHKGKMQAKLMTLEAVLGEGGDGGWTS